MGIIKRLFEVINLNNSVKKYDQFQELKKRAEQGDVNAQYNLGVKCTKGEGDWLIQSYKEAEKWFIEAAEQGCTGSQYNLGCIYSGGVIYRAEGMVTIDDEKAERWFTKAAEQGHKKALYNLEIIRKI